MNKKISKIKLESMKDEFIKQIKDIYTLNLSMLLLEEFDSLQQENSQLKERIDNALQYIENDLQSFLYSIEYNKLLDILKGVK